jgi:hydrogenase maturation protease
VRNAPAPLVVLGLGNVICGDDGLGVAAVSAIGERFEVPERVSLLDGGTLGLSLLGWLSGAEDVLIVDAIRTDAPPGTLVRLGGHDVAPAVRDRLSVHQVGVADLLDALRLLDAWPARMELVGLVPERVELGLGFSPCVDRALPALEALVVAAIRERGHPLRARNCHEAPADPLDGRRAARSLGL